LRPPLTRRELAAINILFGITRGPRLAALTDNRLIYQDGIPVATLSAGKVEFLTALDAKSRPRLN
jgi:hypothetical protein